MILHVLLGFLLAYGLSGLAIGVICLFESRQVKKDRESAVDRLLSDVAIASLDRPTNVRTN